MGNCQAVDAAALVVQHPDGRIERMYWSVCVSEVMKMNPGHYVSLIIPLPVDGEDNLEEKTVRFTRVKLLRPTDKLVLGRAYRLVTSQEVMKVLREKKHAKMMKNLPESDKTLEHQNLSCEAEARSTGLDRTNQVTRIERQRQRQVSSNIAVARSKSWRPSLKSITETAT